MHKYLSIACLIISAILHPEMGASNEAPFNYDTDSGTFTLAPEAFEGLELLGMEIIGKERKNNEVGCPMVARRKSEPKALFSHHQELEIPQDIAFEDSNYHTLTPEEFTRLTDIIAYEDIPKVSADPETFDVPDFVDFEENGEPSSDTESSDGVEEFEISRRPPATEERRFIALSEESQNRIRELTESEEAEEEAEVDENTLSETPFLWDAQEDQRDEQGGVVHFKNQNLYRSFLETD